MSRRRNRLTAAAVLGGLLLGLCPTQVACSGSDANAALVSSAGETGSIPGWQLAQQSTGGGAFTAQSLDASSPDVLGVVSKTGSVAGGAAGWSNAATSRCTVIGCLLNSGALDETKLFFSDNLETQLDRNQFLVPWIYRSEWNLATSPRQHFFLQTHGIASGADIYVNGQRVAGREVQSGAYAGQQYDVTGLVANGRNALAIRAYPTDYNVDLAVGFVDWNPHPPDRGMGVWRNVDLRQTGPVALGPVVVTTTLNSPQNDKASVTVALTLQNLEGTQAAVIVQIVVEEDGGNNAQFWETGINLNGGATTTVSHTVTIDRPLVWWPKQWGSQPFYAAAVAVFADGAKSDAASKRFGIRNVTSAINGYKDVTFAVNGMPFQVVGAGYTSDIFLRFDKRRFNAHAQYALDLGLNTLRLEGKMEHPELYDAADRLGLMILSGWECCDKWEAWSYNSDLTMYLKGEPVPFWNDTDYAVANASIRHEALMMAHHPSVLGFLVGSDYWPDDTATSIYVDGLRAAGWQTPIVASASMRGFPDALGPSGMKMLGPYDWVPPNYWYDTVVTGDGLNPFGRAGAAFGFGSELGAGVGTPELGSLKKFLSNTDLDDLWQSNNKSLFHMSTNISVFGDRSIYNNALARRMGTPTSLDDYLLKAQLMDYEATRAQFEAYATRWTVPNNGRPATGLIYWMFNNAWPSLHWNLFDYYLRPAGAYYGAKVGARVEHVAFDYFSRSVYLINRSLQASGSRTVVAEVLTLDGRRLWNGTVKADTAPNTSRVVLGPIPAYGPNTAGGVLLIRLLLSDGNGNTLSRNVYWVSATLDALAWDQTTWWYTPVSTFADYTALFGASSKLADGGGGARVSAKIAGNTHSGPGAKRNSFTLENHSQTTPAFFVRLNLARKSDGADVVPVFWSDNYVTLWPGEQLTVEMGYSASKDEAAQMNGGSGGFTLQLTGVNVPAAETDVDEDSWTDSSGGGSSPGQQGGVGVAAAMGALWIPLLGVLVENM